MNFIKTYWKWLLIGAGILMVILYINSKTSTSSKLWNYAWKQINAREYKLIDDIEAEKKKISLEKENIAKELKKVQEDRAYLEKKNISLTNAINILEVQNSELKKKLVSITIPERLDDRVRRLRELGLKSAVISPRQVK